ncbi:uncharacterized protein LOC109811015 [Cajanus cajan]|uniref:uncharacterized protein LOC109811015 n=1 Tax=Cajanus cajan TaxID=3821 RepID=UPI00098DA460|nr:uncharacterized protein LOC109811015 [Cajanus cajan]
MFEAHVLHLLRRYLGEYVHGLSSEALRISVWKGDVVLKDLKLKAEALNALKLPVIVKAGFVGTITLKVPWKSLGKEPVIVMVDRVFVLAHPVPDSRTMKEEDREKLFQAKLQQIEEAESATLDAISKSKLGSPSSGNSWLSSLISTIIGNLKISISNVHIRYEDSVSNLGHPFASGVTLAKVAAVTMDEQGNETFDTSGALDRLRKSVQLERLALYHDSDQLPWEIDKRWEDISPQEWIEIFEDGIHVPTDDHKLVSKWARNRAYLVYPINAVMQYHRLGNQERVNPEIPYEKVSLVLTDISLTLTEAQYYDWIKLLEAVSRYKTYMEVTHLRPAVPISKAPYLWWQYAAQAALQQQQKCYRLSWDQIRHLCQRRRRYIQLYVASLQNSPHVNHTEIREIEKDLDSKVILLWRLQAHAKVESVKSKVAAEERKTKKKGWFSFYWRDTEESSLDDASEEQQLKEEWQAINKLLSHQPEEELMSRSAKDMQNMVQYMVTISIGQAAARIISVNQEEIVCGRFEQLHVSTKFKHRSVYCDLLLKYYGLSAPEGPLTQSVYSEQKVNAVVASFVHLPIGENIDWRLSATIAPCHVTVLVESIDRVLEFLKRSKAVSPTVALETATALQMKFEEVTRRAQEQFQMALEEQSRFAFDIDLDAPKVRVPLRTSGSDRCDSHFLLDFGHFTLHTAESQSDEKRQNLYSRFYISGRDIAAFFTDCGSDFRSCSLVKPSYDSQIMNSPISEKYENVYYLIDRCGMAVLVNKIKVPHPSYPSTLVSIQVPNLGIHFSSERYFRIMELLSLLYKTIETCSQPTTDSFQLKLAPWSPDDLATDGRILVWKGLGNSVATWNPCFLVLSGSYLYVFESAKSQSYQRYLSMAGRQVLDVPPTYIGGSPFCIAVSTRGMDIQKALESSSTWILDFREEEEKASWFKGLVQATYQASIPVSVDDVLGDLEGDATSYNTNTKTADIVINGALVELKLFIYGKVGDTINGKLDESLILEIVADGGKVHVLLADGDLTVKMKLHSLKIKDELQGRLSVAPCYLAVSVLKSETLYAESFDSRGKEVFHDDDDSFTDALSEFISHTDGGYCLHNMDLDQQGLMGIASDFESLESIMHEKGTPHEVYYEAEGTSNFVSVSFTTRSSSSPFYDGIDTQMCVQMSKLEFFCNRPTIVALMSFGFDISSGNKVTSPTDTSATSPEKLLVKERTDEKGPVRGLLGFGKERVVYYLNMNVDSVTIFLNKEDGSQLATLVQESFLLDLKVHPSSLSIDGTLGNFRLCDTSLGTDQCWDWLCDIRNPGVESLIKFKFNSYSAEDEDYEGYAYSLQGHLSAVRIVFLYRFVQEIMMYFMELASPHTEEAIKLVDKVGGFEWLIQKYEIDGATALKLDLALDTPIIIVPRNSMSKDFIQLDLGKLQIKNEFSWHGSQEEDPSAVHIDLLHAQILGINMSVGIDGCLGKPMIREGQGLDIFVRRSLRDVFRKVPTFSLEVKVDLLHGIMSDKEYKVILDCTYMNLAEQPRLPASFRGGKSGSRDTIRLLVDKVNLNSQLLLSRTVTIIAVTMNHALLELCNGTGGESPLAHIALEGLWVSYRMTSLSETDLFVTIPKFSVLDVRPDTKPEMRLMLGSSADASKQAATGNVPFLFNPGSFRRTTNEAGVDDMPISTMFLIDYRWRMSSQSYVIRVQQPRVLVVPDFLLAVAEFFVPALGALTGREEKMDPKNDPISRNSSIVLMESIYKQKEDVVHLSPSKQLVADWIGIDEYTYDGCGKVICLSVETDAKEVRNTRFRPIIVIGHGKRLRFVNVKIENGSLLRKYTYLNNDSSYSISSEDGVDMVVPGELPSSDEKSLDDVNQMSGTTDSQSGSNGTQSFSFETQVVSSEFTFYDGTKSFLDDSFYGEKLVRAKLDLSFMYASKEKDTWIRALLKDFTAETDSGLVILDPVDISGGYTSVKDKTNISLLSTDICIHLSLSALSLILNLQSQASAALSFGNATPLVQCTNYDRIWVSEKETGHNNNVTFWRPRAPANYVILGDCVTSRPIPPSQAVMAVSNTYGRVRKPVDFHLIGSFPNIREHDGSEDHSIDDNDCSLWMPIAPPGYTALGCVVNVGNQPPPNHVVYCLRSDLVTSAKYTDCIFNIPSNNHFTSGFSIWRLDNSIGSFFAHSSTGCPLKDRCYDLNHLLVWNSNRAPLIGPVSDYSDQENNNQQTSKSVNTSGWEILKSISKATNCYMSTPNFERIWWDKGSDLRRPVSIWRPIARHGYAVLGDCITEGLEPPALGIIFKNDSPDISSKPVQFTKVSHIVGNGIDEVFFWYPIAPPGYVSLGCVVSRTDEAPRVDLFCCPRMDLVSQANIHEAPLSRSSSSKSPQCWSIWKVENQACTFLARSDLKKPSSRLAYIIGDSVKPKTRENINAELKLRYFSLTILDSLCGMMRPLFDATITNIKLATHGGLNAMNAVLIASIVASTFNAHLEAWEPLVEPFDGIFKFETFDTNVQSPSGLGKRIRISATSILNVNVSAANLECFVGSILSWRRQLELDQKVSKLNEEVGGQHGEGENTTFSALDEDDLQTVIVENKLGCDIFVKKVEHDVDTVDKIQQGDCASVWIPPPRFSNRLNVADESREARYYVAVQILEAKGLPIIDDGNCHNFFCALRLVVDSQASEQQKLFPQSARTKCVKPVVSRIKDQVEGRVKWNELFIFEVPRKAPAKLEIEVTNLAAKAGKGEVVGALSFSVGHGASILKKVASVRMFPTPNDAQNIKSYPLSTSVQQNVEAMHNGCLFASTSYFERNRIANLQNDMESENIGDRDIGFWVGLGTEREWESIRSLLPLSVAPISLQNEYIGMEVVMKNGKKHVIFRGLVTVVNDSDVILNILTSHASIGCDPSLGVNSSNDVTEEVFQNQYYQPTSGWGNNWPGVHNDNPGHWSTRDFSYSSKDFFEPPLPPGWKWASGWSIDKSQNVDKEGWAYGPDIKNLRWPPTSSQFSTKSANDVVRRRRWIRTRQSFSQQGTECLQSGASTVHPGASAVLSWRSTSKNSDHCLQVRPKFDNSQPSYSWGCAIAVGASYIYSKDQLLDPVSRPSSVTPNCSLKLNELEKKDILLCCNPSSGSKQLWFSVGTDASVLNTELNIPVYDWRISINSPLKLENRLPCPAEFSISEKIKEGSCIERHHGAVSSRQSVHIYSVDIQKPLYLTLSVQGGWVMEKDPILALDPSFSNHVSSFWMIHKRSRRKLRLSIEHDMGGTSVAPKTLRLFVPYWIVNDSSLSLAYRVVEVEPLENAEMDSVLLSRAVKSAKTALKNPISSLDRRHSNSRSSLQVLEVIEDNSPFPSMLSPQDYAVRSSTMFQSPKDSYLSPRLGISVSMQSSEVHSSGISLLELEKKERIDVKAFNSDGSYYKLSALLNMTSDRTKVVHFQPHTLFINRFGCSLCLQQCDTQSAVWIHPTDPPKPLGWQLAARVELLKLRIDGYKWSTPFSVSYEGVMRISLKKDTGDETMQIRVTVRSGAKRSRFEVVFRPDSLSSPYRIENRSMFLPIHFRQVDGISDSWRLLVPNSAASFLWEDLGRRRLLELLVDGTDPMKSLKYDIDEISDHQPIHVKDGPTRALRVTIVKEEKINVVKISDWMPENEPTRRHLSSMNDSQKQQLMSITDCEFHINFDLAELGMSIVDHTPEEILYLSVQNLVLAYSTGLGSGISRFKVRMCGLQVDNQLPLTPMPVLFRPQRAVSETDYILKCSITMQSNGSLDLCVYPYIGFHGPESSAAFLINIHEPIIWRLHEMIQQVKLSRLYDSQTTAASVDPIIQIGVLNISEVRFRVSMAMSPSQRPRGVLGFWASLMTALGNTENMPVRINQRFNENVCMRQSSMISMAISNIRKDLLGQPLQLLSGVDILGNASSALGHMSKGVAALSMDKKFIQSRQRQENKGVEDFGDVIREGGGAFAKGLFRGVTGILTKPLEGAKSSGVEGFVQGVGKGIIGAAAQPVSGVLDLLSKTTEGANAMRMKIASAITSDEQLLRRRLPRVISGDNLLQLYDEYKAQGQVILQLAESGSFFGQVDLFKVRGKFALSDAYEDHFMLPKGKILTVTHRRVILLQQPSNIIAQRKFSPARDPCSIIWDILWDDLGTMELTHGKKDNPKGPPSRLILYLQSKSLDTKENFRIIKCISDTRQALQVYSSIDHALHTYGPGVSKGLLKNKVTKPYSPHVDATSVDLSPQQMPGSAPLSSTFGSNASR